MFLLLYLGGTSDELVIPKPIVMVLDQLNECDQQAPGVGAVSTQSLQQDTGYLLPEFVAIPLRKEV